MSDDIIRWLQTAPTTDADVLVQGFAERLLALGIPLWRVNISLLTMHPEVAVRNASWTPEAGCALRILPREMFRTDFYL